MKDTESLTVTTRGDRETVMTRVFAAPRERVYEAFGKPELVKRWFGPRGWSLSVCDMDFRAGGSFRFLLSGPDNRKVGMCGRYIDLEPPVRAIHTESFDDYPGEAQVTSTLIEEKGRTTLTVVILSPSREVRDAVLKSGMQHGAAESYDRLAELLASGTAE